MPMYNNHLNDICGLNLMKGFVIQTKDCNKYRKITQLYLYNFFFPAKLNNDYLSD